MRPAVQGGRAHVRNRRDSEGSLPSPPKFLPLRETFPYHRRTGSRLQSVATSIASAKIVNDIISKLHGYVHSAFLMSTVRLDTARLLQA